MPAVKGSIGGNTINISLGDMTAVAADAYIVPEFNSAASFGGVGGAIARAGASAGLNDYQEYIDKNGEQPYGQVILTPSYGGQSQHLLHVVSVGSGGDKEFSTVQTSIFNALKVAEANGIKKIVIPALGTGIIGRLSDEQSAKAMMSAIHDYAQSGGTPIEVSFVLFARQPTQDTFARVLSTRSYENVASEAGSREISLVRWQEGMSSDAEADRRFAAQEDAAMRSTHAIKPMKPIVMKKKKQPGG